MQLPGQCILCGLASGCHEDLCPPCQQSLPLLDHQQCCRQCALPLAPAGAQQAQPHLCGQCLHQPPPFLRSVALCGYLSPAKELISAFKYRKQHSYGRVLSELLSKEIARAYTGQALPEAIIPMPLHWRRRFQRGFNQSEHIAQQLSRQLGLPVQRLLQHPHHQRKQQSLDARQRQRNLRRAFHCRHALQGRYLVVVDDVMTTGATARAMAQCLRQAGAARVDIWCLARTPKAR